MSLRRRLEVTPLEDRTVPATVTIEAIADATEGGSSGTFRLTRDGSTSSALTVYVEYSGTASGGDYNFTGLASYTTELGTVYYVTIPASSSTADVTVAAVNDSTSEPTETVVMTITTDPGYTVGNPDSATVSILDNDAQYVSVATVVDASEDGYEGIFQFTRIGDLSSSLQVNYTVGGTATAEDDYEELSETVTFEAGSATAEVQVAAVHDTIYDPGETVVVTVSTGTGYSVGAQDEATVTIYDDADRTFEVASEEGAVWYDIDWSQWDSDDQDPQQLPLTDFTLNFAGQVFTESNATITGAVAVVEYNQTLEGHEVTDIQFTVEFASEVSGVKTLVADDGEVTAFDDSSQQIGDPAALADNGEAAVILDFSKVDFPTAGEVHWHFAVKSQESTTVYTMPLTLTPTTTPEALRLAIETQLKKWHFQASGSGTSLTIMGPSWGNQLSIVSIVHDGAANAKGPGVGYITGHDQTGPPIYSFIKDQ